MHLLKLTNDIDNLFGIWYNYFQKNGSDINRSKGQLTWNDRTMSYHSFG